MPQNLRRALSTEGIWVNKRHLKRWEDRKGERAPAKLAIGRLTTLCGLVIALGALLAGVVFRNLAVKAFFVRLRPNPDEAEPALNKPEPLGFIFVVGSAVCPFLGLLGFLRYWSKRSVIAVPYLRIKPADNLRSITAV